MCIILVATLPRVSFSRKYSSEVVEAVSDEDHDLAWVNYFADEVRKY